MQRFSIEPTDDYKDMIISEWPYASEAEERFDKKDGVRITINANITIMETSGTIVITVLYFGITVLELEKPGKVEFVIGNSKPYILTYSENELEYEDHNHTVVKHKKFKI